MQRRVGLLVLRAGVHVHVDAKQEQQALHVLLQDGQVQEVVALVVILKDGRDTWWFDFLFIYLFLMKRRQVKGIKSVNKKVCQQRMPVIMRMAP